MNSPEILSLQGQIISLGEQVDALKGQIISMASAIQGKVNRVSLRYKDDDHYGILGAGLVQVKEDGAGEKKIVIGNASLFLSQAYPGAAEEGEVGEQPSITPVTGLRIEIEGQESTIVSVESNTKLRVSTAFDLPTDKFYFYILEQPVSQETLVGDFSFGLPNVGGDSTAGRFRGTILSNSELHYKGMQTEDDHVATVKYVGNRLLPLSVAAANAIQRTGDTVIGPSDDANKGDSMGGRYVYDMDRLNWRFGAKTKLQYRGEQGRYDAPETHDNVMTYRMYNDNLICDRPTVFGAQFTGFRVALPTVTSITNNYILATRVLIPADCKTPVIAAGAQGFRFAVGGLYMLYVSIPFIIGSGCAFTIKLQAKDLNNNTRIVTQGLYFSKSCGVSNGNAAGDSVAQNPSSPLIGVAAIKGGDIVSVIVERLSGTNKIMLSTQGGADGANNTEQTILNKAIECNTFTAVCLAPDPFDVKTVSETGEVTGDAPPPGGGGGGGGGGGKDPLSPIVQ